jgi:serine/threonine protein kinase
MNGELVAVKVIKKEHSEEVLREMETMTTFHHSNILELLGIAQNAGSLSLLFYEYVQLFSLLRKYPTSFALRI